MLQTKGKDLHKKDRATLCLCKKVFSRSYCSRSRILCTPRARSKITPHIALLINHRTMLLKIRVFDRRKKIMHYMSPLVAFGKGVGCAEPTAELKPEDPIMVETNIDDDTGHRMWEADIAECGVQTSYGVVLEKGCIVWRSDLNHFTVNLHQAYEGKETMDIVSLKYLGNIYENPDIMSEEQAYAKPKKQTAD